MKRNVVAGMLGFVLLVGAVDGHAEKWVKNNVDVPNQNLEANYYDSQSVKVRGKTISWTEKFVLTDFGEKAYSKHLMQYPACSASIEKKGTVAYHKIDFEIKDGKFRTVAKRNYNKNNELICTDKEMGTEFDKNWYEIVYKSPMYERHYILVTKYKLGNL
ncbi:hypothetical protein [Geomobilimonas luticola]|uniref:Uncharacterized protein n=1 Tax=Geomobilimonas luticola TaxID=1114878 RepID=A0ABS5SEQ0_9BACT|nr:hypothetical protein [Geomobilimonas luticola]MBT0653839.1 hypothetical protein [Geomobilimonas luticola]